MMGNYRIKIGRDNLNSKKNWNLRVFY